MHPGVRSRRLTRAGWGLAAIAAVALAMPMASVHAAPQTETVCADDEEVQFLDLINAYRAENGLGPLALSQSLSVASDAHSVDMASRGYFDHVTPDGATVEQKLRAAGYQGGTFGENIVAGTETAEEALQAWKDSPTHNENMLRASFGAIGIGRYNDPNSAHGWYWTTNFGGEIDAAGAVCGQEPADDGNGSRERKRAVTNDPDVNLRTGPGRDYPVAQTVAEGTAFDVLGEERDGYLPVLHEGMETWVAAEWVDILAPAGSVEAAQPAAEPAPVTVTETVNLREAPSREAVVLTMVPQSSEIELTGETADGYLRATYEGLTGWIDATYVLVPDDAAVASGVLEQAQPATARPQAVAAATSGDKPVGSMTVIGTNLNLRGAPSRGGEVLDVIPAGTTVRLTGEEQDGYLGASFGGKDGWVDAAYIP